MGFFHDNDQVEVRGWVANRMMSAYEAVQRVRELHHPFTHNGFDGLQEYCNHCSYSQLQEYPCPTIKALDGENNE